MDRRQTVFWGSMFATAWALTAHPQPAVAGGLVCTGDGAAATCTLQLSKAMSFECAANGVTELTTASGYAMIGDVTLHTPAQDFTLFEATLVFEATATGETLPYQLYGMCRAPLGQMGLTDNPVSVSPMAGVGVVTRKTLQGLLDGADNRLPLAENDSYAVAPAYLFFHFATGVELDLQLAERLGLNTDDGAHDPFQYAFPGDMSLTMIFDPTDPYVYMSSDARKLLFGSSDNDAETKPAEQEQGQEQATERDEQTQTPAESDTAPAANADDGKKKKHDKADGEDGAGKGSGISLGAFATSLHGGIPFTPQMTWGLPDTVPSFKGQLYVDTTVPLPYGIEVSGPLVTYAGADGFEQGGNGDVAVGFSIFGDVLGMEFPLGSATAGYGVHGERAYAYFSGTLAPDDSFLPDWVPIVPAAEAQVAAYIDSAHVADTRLQAHGRFNLDAGNLGRMTGVDLNELFVREGDLTVDRHGVWLRGRSATSIHPDLVFGSEVVVEALFSADNFDDSYILLRGDMTIGGTALGSEAEAMITPRGVFVSGSFSTPVSRIALSGAITAQGPVLTGSAGVDFNLDGLHQAQQDAQRAIRNAQADVERLTGEIVRMRTQVAKERQRDAKNVDAARQDVADQQGQVDKLQTQIDRNKSAIAAHQRKISDWNKWYKRQPWYKKTWAWARYLKETGWRYAKIAELGTAIAGLETAKATATAALKAAQGVLAGLEQAIVHTPIDADPRVAALIAARETARGTLQAAQGAVSVVDIPTGSLSGEIALTLSVAGLHGDMTANYNGHELV
ncbi:MAG TPA: hypothetical protein P5572_00165, partial [Phycisphaerae bacterium]|nr:hypothetical protein [Phycisphaerae bacterium]